MTAQVAAHGRLGRDPTMRETAAGQPMALATLAVSVPHREGGEDGEPHPWWLNIMAFGRCAEDLGRCRKGETASVAGTLQHSAYTAKDGERREGWTLIADTVIAARTARPRGGKRAEPGP